jgi:hypothetical protein
MDEQQKDALLGEIATEAGVERASFLTDAGGQFVAFINDNKERIKELGGLVLIDDDPEYLSITEEGTFRSRTRFQDDSGEWVSETEEIDSAAELVEIYNPSDLYAAFADAARDEAGLDPQPTAAEDLLEVAGVASEMGVDQDEGSASDDDWIDRVPTPTDKPEAARYLYDLALTFQEKSQRSEARLLDDFQDASAGLAGMLGDNKILEDEDERMWFKANGAFEAEVVPERDEDGEPQWQALGTPEDMVQFYDPTDLFGDLAEAIAETHPHVAPELDGDDEDGAGEKIDADDADSSSDESDET